MMPLKNKLERLCKENRALELKLNTYHLAVSNTWLNIDYLKSALLGMMQAFSCYGRNFAYLLQRYRNTSIKQFYKSCGFCVEGFFFACFFTNGCLINFLISNLTRVYSFNLLNGKFDLNRLLKLFSVSWTVLGV